MICLHTVKWLQVLLFNTNYSIQHYSFVRIQLNSPEYCYISLKIQLNISQVLPLQVRVDLGARAIKRYSIFPKTPRLEPHHQDLCRGVRLLCCGVEESYPSAEMQSVNSIAPAD